METNSPRTQLSILSGKQSEPPENARARGKAGRVLALAHIALARDFQRYPLSIARRLQISPAHYKIAISWESRAGATRAAFPLARAFSRFALHSK